MNQYTTLGNVKHPLYHTWRFMKQRCENKNQTTYHLYGGRGIKVCHEWQNFWTFVSDMGPKPSPKHTLDRIDNNGNYERGNCRWATAYEQGANTRKAKIFEFNGERLSQGGWARKIGISHTAMKLRLKKWPLSRALSTYGPVRGIAASSGERGK